MFWEFSCVQSRKVENDADDGQNGGEWGKYEDRHVESLRKGKMRQYTSIWTHYIDKYNVYGSEL